MKDFDFLTIIMFPSALCFMKMLLPLMIPDAVIFVVLATYAIFFFSVLSFMYMKHRDSHRQLIMNRKLNKNYRK